MLESLLSLASPRSSGHRAPALAFAALYHTLIAVALWALSLRLVALQQGPTICEPMEPPPVPVEFMSKEFLPPPAPAKANVVSTKPPAPEPTPQVPEVAAVEPLPDSAHETLTDSNAPTAHTPDGPLAESGTPGDGPIGERDGSGGPGGGDTAGPAGEGNFDPCELVPCQIDSTIRAPVALAQPDPDYPRVMVQARLEGDVELEIVIGIRGEVESVQVVSGNEPFVSAAVQAVKRWRYRAAERSGVPIRIVHRVVVRFRLR